MASAPRQGRGASETGGATCTAAQNPVMDTGWQTDKALGWPDF